MGTLTPDANFWRHDAAESEERFRQHVCSAVLECQWALRKGDMRLAARWRDVYFARDGEYNTEPFVSIFESGMMSIGLYFADSFALKGKYSAAYNIVGRFYEELSGYQQRRLANNMPYAPQSENRCLAALVLARCKWRSPKDPNAVRSPDNIADTYLEVGDRIVTFAAAHVGYGSQVELVKITGIAVARMLYRHKRSRCQEIIDNFNRLHGLWLNLEHRVPDGTNLANLPDWYWDFRIGAGLIDGQLSQREFDSFNRRRKASAREFDPGVPRTAEIIEWESQRPSPASSGQSSSYTRSRRSSELPTEGQPPLQISS